MASPISRSPASGTASEIHRLVTSMLLGDNTPSQHVNLSPGAAPGSASFVNFVPTLGSSAQGHGTGQGSASPALSPASGLPSWLAPAIANAQPAVATGLINTAPALPSPFYCGPSSHVSPQAHAQQYSQLPAVTDALQFSCQERHGWLPGVHPYDILRSGQTTTSSSASEWPSNTAGALAGRSPVGGTALADGEASEGVRSRDKSPFAGREMGALTTDRAKSKACLPCRQLKKKCDGSRPCRSCWNKGTSEACRDDDKIPSCSMCRSRRLKCDRQRPCSRCVKSGHANACTGRDGDWLTRLGDAGDSLIAVPPTACHLPSLRPELANPGLAAGELGVGSASLDAIVHSSNHAAAADSNPWTLRHDGSSPGSSPALGRSSPSEVKGRQEEEDSGILAADAAAPRAGAAGSAPGVAARVEAGGKSSAMSTMMLGSGSNARMRGILLRQQGCVMVQRPIKKRLALDVSSCHGNEDILGVLNMVGMNYDYNTPMSPSGSRLHNPLSRVLDAGYQLSFFARLMNSVPREIKEAIDEGMRTLCTLQKLVLAERARATSCGADAAAAPASRFITLSSDAHSSVAPTAPPGGLWASNKESSDKAPASPAQSCSRWHGGAAACAAGGDDDAGAAATVSCRAMAGGTAALAAPARGPPGSSPSVSGKRKMPELGGEGEGFEEGSDAWARKASSSSEDDRGATDYEEHLFELVQQLAARHNMSDKCGAFCFDWDPQTGRRKNIYVTESLSEILGSHTEELLARVGSREHQAPHSELEFLSRLFSEFLGPHDCSSVLMGKDGNMHYMDSYTRIIVCDPKTRKLKKAFLARAVGIRELDAESNVFRTINLIDPVSVEQFEGRRRDILLDDDRDGQDLLADASKDYLFDESLDRLKNDSSKVSTVIRVIQQKTLRLKAIVRDLELRMLAHDGEGASLLVGGHGTGEGQAAFEAGQPSRGPGGSSSDAS